MNRCNWLSRWWHNRKRRLDREILLPIMREAASNQYPFSPGDAHRALQYLWVDHMAGDMQKHWTCPCSQGCRRGVLDEN